jgi:UDP-glucose:glycoprotein glucosyltransferase
MLNMASSVISAIVQPDPTELGLFNAPPQPRRRNYNLLDDTYT